ncbi:unnamed protein product [Ilex paraguariensis]|uniref:Nucleolar 27S pre-rRNA processing Urb2/Npa2 C-terminal domain-containing protein n=1 Tax=Ilex paraguariensis TaxID=185542 RepID=A0ABC8R2V4_9AQUA
MPDWPEVLTAFENSLAVVSERIDAMDGLASGAEAACRMFAQYMDGAELLNLAARIGMGFVTIQLDEPCYRWIGNILDILLESKGIRYITLKILSSCLQLIFLLKRRCKLDESSGWFCTLRLVLGSLLDLHGASHSHYHYDLFRLFVSCRRALKNLTVASCEEKMEASQFSLSCILFESPYPVLWLLKSMSAVIRCQCVFSEDNATKVKDMIFSLVDHTAYLFLTLSKDKFVRAIHSHILYGKLCEEKSSSVIAQERCDGIEDDPYLNSGEDIDARRSVVLVAETLKEQVQNILVSLKEVICDEKKEPFTGVQEYTSLSTIISCLQGFLWGLASALDNVDAPRFNVKIKFSRWKFEPLHEVNLCLDTVADFINYSLRALLVEDDQCFADFDDTLHGQEQQNCGNARNFSTTAAIKEDSSKSVWKKKSHSGNAESILTKVDLSEQLCLRKSLLQGFLRGEDLEAAFFLRQLFIASSAILKLNLQTNRNALSSSLISILIGISRVLLVEFASKVEVPQPFSFVWLDSVVMFLEELGSYFPSSNPTLSRNLYVKLVDLHLRAIGKCISLQGKGATLTSHETESSTKMLNGQMGLSECNISQGPYLDEFKGRLRMSFKAFLKRPSELHLFSVVQAIERALVGMQEGCMINYELQTGSSDGGKVSSTVAAGIDCLDLVLEFVTGRKRLSVVKTHIQSLVTCLFNIILHLQGPKIFYGKAKGNRGDADPDPGSVLRMCVEVLTRVFGKHALLHTDTCHVVQSLRVPAAIFQSFLQLRIYESPGRSDSPRFSDTEGPESVISKNTCVVDRQFSIELYDACCRLLCTVLKHHKSESQRCVAILEDSVCILLRCLEMVNIDPVVRKGYFSWEVQEGVKCACFLRRVYEEFHDGPGVASTEIHEHKCPFLGLLSLDAMATRCIRQQKDVFGRNCFQFLSNYVSIYCGYGPIKTGFRREIDEALRPGVYALIDACSADDLQYLHTVFGEGPCRSTLATLQHDYKQNFQYGGKPANQTHPCAINLLGLQFSTTSCIGLTFTIIGFPLSFTTKHNTIHDTQKKHSLLYPRGFFSESSSIPSSTILGRDLHLPWPPMARVLRLDGRNHRRKHGLATSGHTNWVGVPCAVVIGYGEPGKALLDVSIRASQAGVLLPVARGKLAVGRGSFALVGTCPASIPVYLS